VIVAVDGIEYLTDVGFGEFAFGPLQLELDKMQIDDRGHYVIDKYDHDYLRVSKIENGEYNPEYIFKNIHREFNEFDKMCHYHQTNPESHFTQKRLITIPTEMGRITLAGDTLKTKTNNSIEEKKLKGETGFEKKLLNYFKIVMQSKPATSTK